MRSFFYKIFVSALESRRLAFEQVVRQFKFTNSTVRSVTADINDSPNSASLFRSTTSRVRSSQCFRKHRDEDVLESIFERARGRVVGRTHTACMSREMIFWCGCIFCAISASALRRRRNNPPPPPPIDDDDDDTRAVPSRRASPRRFLQIAFSYLRPGMRTNPRFMFAAYLRPSSITCTECITSRSSPRALADFQRTIS